MNLFSIFYMHKEGGFTRRLYSLYITLAQEGHSLYYLSSEKLPVEHENIKPLIWPSLKTRKKGGIFWVFFIIYCLINSGRVIKHHRIDKIITFSPFYTFLCAFPIMLRRVTAITFIRADNMLHSKNILRNIFFYFADRFGIKISQKIVVNSLKLKRIYQDRYRIQEQMICLLPNNIPKTFNIKPSERTMIRHSLELRSGDFLISTSGVFNPGKNFGYLIEVLKMLNDKGIKLVIIGDELVPNGERNRLEKLRRQLRLEENVTFSGWKNDPCTLIASSDLFIFPSRFEGSPNSLLEALGCGVPCLGSNIDEIAEILFYDELLFPLNDIDHLVNKINKLRSDFEYYQRLNKLTRQCSKRYLFDWDREVKMIIAGESNRIRFPCVSQ
ncbi:glycosyltransferase [bacterium]|nr:glycosyltransferase [bacterium]